MKLVKTKKKGLDLWVLTTNAGTLLGTYWSEAAARTRAMQLGAKGGAK